MAVASGVKTHASRKGAKSPGRPARPQVRFSMPTAVSICARVAAGEATARMCRENKMPSVSTLYRWRDDIPEFALMLARARDIAADAAVDEALAIAAATTKETVTADRLKISTLLWRAVHGVPKRYGAKAGDPAAAANAADDKATRPILARIRRFEPVAREDGTVFTREILPDGSTLDHGE